MESPRLSKGERTQREILDAAKTLFLAQGFAATSMRQIAGAVGITPAAIYNHFASKEEIFTTLVRAEAPYEQLFALYDTAAAETPEGLVQQVFRGLMDLLALHKDYVRLALIDAQERDGATLVTFIPELVSRALAFYQRLVELDVAQGRLRGVSPFVFMRALISLVAGYLVTERLAKSAQTLQLPEIDWPQGLADVFLHGVVEPQKSGGE